MKKIALFLVLLLGVIALSACGDNEPTQEEIIANAEQATLKVITRTAGVSIEGNPGEIIGAGSAWVYDADEGLIVTNAHVVVDGGSFTAGYSSSQLTKATIVGVDFPNDIAVLAINPALLSGLTELPLADPESIEQGEPVTALGYPGNGNSDFLQTPFQATSGSLSAIDGVELTVAYGYFTNENSGIVQSDLYQTDAAINPGNSGGPLIDSEGSVVGVNYAGGGEDQAGVIPSEKLETIIPALVDGDSTAWAGFGVSALPTETANFFGLDGGMEITQVTKDTPADQAGLTSLVSLAAKQPEGSNYLIILSVNNQPVGNMEQYVNALTNVQSGESVQFKVGIPGLGTETANITYP